MNNAFFENSGHFDNAIDLATLDCFEGMKVDNIVLELENPFSIKPVIMVYSFYCIGSTIIETHQFPPGTLLQ